jgi:hypothetical protein
MARDEIFVDAEKKIHMEINARFSLGISGLNIQISVLTCSRVRGNEVDTRDDIRLQQRQ